MTPITVACPKCDKTFKVVERFSGTSGPCPNCKHMVEVPASQKIAILGLAANPPTLGHQVAAMAVHAVTGMDVSLMPCYQHRFGKEMIDAIYRDRMCKLMCAHSRPWMTTTSFEIIHGIAASTYEIMKLMREEYKHDFHIVIGMDNANVIQKWTMWERLIEEFPFIVLGRPGYDPTSDWFLKPPHRFVDVRWPISSTEIREAIARDDYEFAARNLNKHVWEYIRIHKLHGVKL